ncbi:ParB/RepB/Spo0J family partition protein [Klebsiella michiganensis]|jgi:ParB/RepB/Spo0J family partition protein|uniref:ParB/RepB/Spo0J family partition protein n=1 Tax=Klebsiella michiganensis TaxID=1134687 RepID=UPI001FFD2C9C|nr:DNA-binding protein [Klebsiella michiganensis]MCK2101898.1 DNA-binding protein [Klebsiella michiganensis]MDQ4327721.1 DNA-binding protein [Klebsiella michiganensis]
MSSLYQLYKHKGKNGTGTSVNKTYIVPVSELYVEPGFNVREIDQDHVAEFRDAFIDGEYVPPLAVQVTERGIKIIDGHHRYYGALAATEAGHPILRIECKDFVGTDADRIAFMVTSSQGKPLTPIERGNAYQRLVNQGWEHAEIAKKVKRSVSDVVMHIELVSCDDPLLEMVRAGEVAATTAVALSREHGTMAASIAARQMDKARASGKAKLTRSAALPQFSAAKARQFIQIVADQVDLALPTEASAILDNYREFLKEAGWESEA